MSRLDESQIDFLARLGLSIDAITVFQILHEEGPQTAHSVSLKLGRFSSAQYRLFYLLEKFGLVRREGVRPLRFVALPLETGFSAALALKEHELSQLLVKSFNRGKYPEDLPQLRLVVGRQALYAEYARLAPLAKHTIDAYTIGIAYSDDLVAVQRSAIKRGVRIRHVIQQLKPSNYHVAHTWQRLGVHLRLSKAERGFHLMIFDDNGAIITFSDPNNTDDRVSIITQNTSVVKIFSAYFNQIWSSARAVDV